MGDSVVNHFGSEGERLLQQKYRSEEAAKAFYKNQMVNYLTVEMMNYIEKQEMLFISTADKKGNCDCSFRYGEAGFVKVIDKWNVIYPEYRGNGVNASLGNIYENPHIGLLFLDFYENRVGLHINGKAKIYEVDDLDEIFEQSFVSDLKENEFAKRWIVVKVEEAYIHCSKHIPHLKKIEKDINWGTDDPKLKGGDYFKVKKIKSLTKA